MQICQYHNKKLCIFAVAPFAGAWIEIIQSPHFFGLYFRRSLRVSVDWNLQNRLYSPSCACRSLRGSVDWNNFLAIINNVIPVAPFAGAWIEIVSLCSSYSMSMSLPSRERGLKWVVAVRFLIKASRSLRGSVDWNMWSICIFFCRYRRSLRGSVDWNRTATLHRIRAVVVAPFAGAWIEIMILSLQMRKPSGRSLRGSVDWNIFLKRW